MLRKLALALDEAHQAGVVHRDLKPANIMIDRRVEPIIMDFGLARRRAETEVALTHSGQIIGTPAYMSPEQVRGRHEQIGPASDVYALGVIGYQMLTGRRPFSGSLGEVMAGILSETPPSPARISAQVNSRIDEICQKAMAKSQEERYRSAKELAADLDAYLRELPSGTRGESASEANAANATAAKAGLSTKHWVAVAAMVLLLTALTLGVVLPRMRVAHQQPGTSDSPPKTGAGADGRWRGDQNGSSGVGSNPSPSVNVAATTSTHYGLQFSGQSIVSSGGFPFDGTQPFCLEAYVRPTRVDGEHWIFEYGNGVRLMISESDWLGFVSQSMTHQVFVDELPRENQRYHVAFVRDRDQIQLFVNGRGGRKNSLSDTTIPNGANTRLQIGRSFEGVIEGVRISHVARYDQDFTPPPLVDDAGTVALYLFNEGNGTTASDGSKNNYPATIVDVSWIELEGVPLPTREPLGNGKAVE